jgi:hypothetical protein
LISTLLGISTPKVLGKATGDLVVFAGKGKGYGGPTQRKGVALRPMGDRDRTGDAASRERRPLQTAAVSTKPACSTTDPGRPNSLERSAIAVNCSSIRMLTTFVSAILAVAPFHAGAGMAMIRASVTVPVLRYPGRSLKAR